MSFPLFNIDLSINFEPRRKSVFSFTSAKVIPFYCRYHSRIVLLLFQSLLSSGEPAIEGFPRANVENKIK
jgi:hypothetical protein